jgi:hypothetical protein
MDHVSHVVFHRTEAASGALLNSREVHHIQGTRSQASAVSGAKRLERSGNSVQTYMPIISTFYGILIQMFWNDHPPPHFHVRYADARARVSIHDLQLISGALPRTAERLVLEWAQLHQAELMENWLLCERQAQPTKIAPLP